MSRNSSLVPPIRPGMKVQTRVIFPYLLPKGLPVGTEVTVVRVEGDFCKVRSENGREWTVHSLLIDPGELVWVDGHWVNQHADKPAA